MDTPGLVGDPEIAHPRRAAFLVTYVDSEHGLMPVPNDLADGNPAATTRTPQHCRSRPAAAPRPAAALPGAGQPGEQPWPYHGHREAVGQQADRDADSTSPVEVSRCSAVRSVAASSSLIAPGNGSAPDQHPRHPARRASTGLCTPHGCGRASRKTPCPGAVGTASPCGARWCRRCPAATAARRRPRAPWWCPRGSTAGLSPPLRAHRTRAHCPPAVVLPSQPRAGEPHRTPQLLAMYVDRRLGSQCRKRGAYP